jgi:hypothetical protein
MVHEFSRTEELAERRRTHSADHAGLEVEEHRAWYKLDALSFVINNIDAADLRANVAAVLAVAGDAVLVAQHLHGARPKPTVPRRYLVVVPSPIRSFCVVGT